MLLHIDGSHHQWFQDGRWYDLIMILDDATSEIYNAQLVEDESTLTLFRGNCYCTLLATLEKTLFAFPPTKRTVPITRTRITASITAYSAMS